MKVNHFQRYLDDTHSKSWQQQLSYSDVLQLAAAPGTNHILRSTVLTQYPGLRAQSKSWYATYFSLVISARVSDYDVKSFRGSWRTCLHLVGRGRNAGERGDEPLVYADAPQEDAFVQELVVIVQQDRRAIYRGKSNSRNTNLRAIIKPVRWLRSGGMRHTEGFLLTALMKRLSVAAGKISFSRVMFLQVGKQHEALDLRCRFTASEHYYPKTAHMFEEPDLVQQRSRMFLKGPPEKWNIAGFHICVFLHANVWWWLCDSDVTLPGESIQLKP